MYKQLNFILNIDTIHHICAFLDPDSIKSLSVVSKSVRSDLSGLSIQNSRINLSDYEKDMFKYQCLVIDTNREVILNQIFSKVIYQVENNNLNIDCPCIHIRYNCLNINWLSEHIILLHIEPQRKRFFNSSVDRLINLKCLTIHSRSFNQSINITSLQELYLFCSEFNQDLSVLVNLKKLIINCNAFDQPVNNLVQLTKLSIESEIFNQPIHNLVNLTYLNIYSRSFNQPINFGRLKYLYICYEFNDRLNFPDLIKLTIISRIFNQSIDNLTNLEHVDISSSDFDQTITLNKIKNLSIKSWTNIYNRDVNHLTTLEYLSIESSRFDRPIDQLILKRVYIR